MDRQVENEVFKQCLLKNAINFVLIPISLHVIQPSFYTVINNIV